MEPTCLANVFYLPLADGAIPLICPEDLAANVRMYDNPERSAGLNLAISTQHVSGEEAFTSVIGQSARYEDVEIEEYLTEVLKFLPNGAETKIATTLAPNDPRLVAYRQDFRAWRNLYRASGSNKGHLTRDYQQLDELLPNRIESVAEWMEKAGYTGEAQSVLKDWSDKGLSQRLSRA
ncbi:hypothetical protein V1506DRAFT_522417 [Lipomyces tetrasporus]